MFNGFPASEYAVAIFQFCFCFLALIPLIIAFVVFFTTPSLRQSQQNYLFISFLLTCLVFICLNIVFIGYSVINNSSELVREYCDINGFFVQFCATMEVYSLAALAIERYYAIIRQQRLTKYQILGLIGFGWFENLVLASCPFWIPGARYSISPSNLGCLTDFQSREQLGLSIFIIGHGSMVMGTIVFCYMRIFQEYRKIQNNFNKNNPITTLMTQHPSVEQKSANTEFRILLTVGILAGWTAIAWSPYLITIFYSTITGASVSAEFDMAAAAIVFICICSDSVILLIFDGRWNAATKKLMSKMRKIPYEK